MAGVEFGLAALSAAALALALRKRAQWTSSWICLIVGVHFVPLAVIFGDGYLHVLAAVLVLVALVSVVVSRRTGIHRSAIVGLSAGATLWLFAISSALSVLFG